MGAIGQTYTWPPIHSPLTIIATKQSSAAVADKVDSKQQQEARDHMEVDQGASKQEETGKMHGSLKPCIESEEPVMVC